MISQQDAGLVERLNRKYPSEVVHQLAVDNQVEITDRDGVWRITDYLNKIEFDADELRRMDPDVYQYLMVHREAEVNAVLDAPAKKAAATKRSREEELAIWYAEVRNERVPAAQFVKWIKDNYEADLVRLESDYPQLGKGHNEISAYNFNLIGVAVIRKDQEPSYQNVLTAFQELAVPANGAYPKLKLFVSENEFLTGRPLREYIQQHPEILEPAKIAPPKYQTQSADEFLADSPELQDHRVPQLLQARFDREFQAFIASDTSRAFTNVLASLGVNDLRIFKESMVTYMERNNLQFTDRNFERAALEVAKVTKVNGEPLSLAIDDASGLNAKYGGTTLHDAGGDFSKHRAGMTDPSKKYADVGEKSYTPREARRLINSLTADELKERLAVDVPFRNAVDAL